MHVSFFLFFPSRFTTIAEISFNSCHHAYCTSSNGKGGKNSLHIDRILFLEEGSVTAFICLFIIIGLHGEESVLLFWLKKRAAKRIYTLWRIALFS